MFDAKKTAEKLVGHSIKCGVRMFLEESGCTCGRAGEVEKVAAALSQAKAEGIAEGRKQAVTVVSGMADQAAAAAKKFVRSRNDAMLMIYSAVRDALKATVNTIESLPLEPQPLETKGTDNGG